MQEAAGINEPDYGVLLDDLFVAEGSVIPTDRLFQPLAEAELAFVLREPLAGPSVNAADVIRATDFVLPCIEVVDRRFSERGVLVDTIADNASSGLVVLGGNPVGLGDIDIRTIGVTLTKNGVIEDTGVASAVMGNPINAVAWLANKLHTLRRAAGGGPRGAVGVVHQGHPLRTRRRDGRRLHLARHRAVRRRHLRRGQRRELVPALRRPTPVVALSEEGTRMAARVMVGLGAIAAGVVGWVSPAFACGGLVGENGTIQLVRTSTLVAYHDGVERYVTSFDFTGEGKEVGSIIPLPGVPTTVERGGDWTLQRLALEVAPPAAGGAQTALTFPAAAGDAAEVLLETKIDALDITVLRGGGDAVGRWALDHGFFLSPDAPEVLDFYASRSPVFMAARFDASRAAALGQQAGDGTPIMLTIPIDRPWVPLRILGLGAEPDRTIDADVFLLTDDRPQLLAGGPGLALERSEAARAGLLSDLRSDKGMEWVPDDMWLTYLRLSTPGRRARPTTSRCRRMRRSRRR